MSSSSRHVLLVGLDGLRLDLVDERSAPHLCALRAGGSCTDMEMVPPTDSGPGWSTLLTGASSAEHGVLDNSFTGSRLVSWPDLLTRAHAADAGRTTFAAAGWPPLVDPADVGPVIHTRAEQRRAGTHRVVARDGELYGYRTVDAEIADVAVAHLRHSGPHVSFVYFCGADEAGHVHGARTPEYTAAITRVDALLGRLVTAVEQRVQDAGEDWLVAVTTDHGHRDEGGHGGSEPEVTRSFVVRHGFGRPPAPWPARIEPTELTPRLLAHLAGDGRAPRAEPAQV